METSALQLAVTHLNAPVGSVVSIDHLVRALRSGSVTGLDETVAAVISYLFVELEPGLIARCVREAGSDLRRANELYKESLADHVPRKSALGGRHRSSDLSRAPFVGGSISIRM